MFVINPTTSSISSLAKKSFPQLGLTERSNLQEWIAGNPEVLGEKLLIIQKEFSGLRNKVLFNALAKHKDTIEANFGEPLDWERMDDKKSSRLSFYKPGLNYFNEEEWPEIISFLITYLNKLEAVVTLYLPEIKAALTTSIKDIREPLEEEIV